MCVYVWIEAACCLVLNRVLRCSGLCVCVCVCYASQKEGNEGEKVPLAARERKRKRGGTCVGVWVGGYCVCEYVVCE